MLKLACMYWVPTVYKMQRTEWETRDRAPALTKLMFPPRVGPCEAKYKWFRKLEFKEVTKIFPGAVNFMHGHIWIFLVFRNSLAPLSPSLSGSPFTHTAPFFFVYVLQICDVPSRSLLSLSFSSAFSDYFILAFHWTDLVLCSGDCAPCCFQCRCNFCHDPPIPCILVYVALSLSFHCLTVTSFVSSAKNSQFLSVPWER